MYRIVETVFVVAMWNSLVLGSISERSINVYMVAGAISSLAACIVLDHFGRRANSAVPLFAVPQYLVFLVHRQDTD